ncbi:putative chaperone-binding protein [Phaeoacremonium minimum UCRPA7]|uniref:Putative chaperone-binding protein n=1 Tax=Phaeoacremonium minimum (strain UCR-PA7) TaxID=1286976 RepID=R8BE24_PHAM7|nr:putative chaperone-binding protein [Phaeoacremonium minimum UCRPA7]EON97556.1 putative chaperone-binding protein [Phaeoacremonium minimum UCRPA7]
MVDFEWDSEQIPGYKLGLHILQILFAFTAWCLEIAVFRADDSKVNGRNGWTFAVCFLTIPAWIYLIMAPRWPRTRRLAEPHAMVTVDALFTVLWLSAFATQAAYNSKDECGKGCSLSKAIVAMGVFVTLFFAGTTFLSVATLRYYDFNGTLPGYEHMGVKNQNIDPDKAAFSTAPHDDDAYAPVGMHDHDHEPEFNATPYGGAGSSYGGGGSAYSNAPHDPHDPDAYNMRPVGGGSPAHENPFDDSTAYQGAGGRLPSGSSSHVYAPPAAHDDYDDDRPAQFPAADYGRIH